jgi:predicted TIM-barrel fold metal-dependent hydrolase
MRIDFHCHIFREGTIKDSIDKQFNHFSGYGFYERIKEGLKKIKIINRNNIIEKTLFYIRKAQLDKVVLLPINMSENRQAIGWHRQATDIFIPFFNPPEKSTPQINIENILEEAIQDGIKGLKIMLSFRKKFLNDEILYPSFEIAQKHDLPVLFHTGYPPPGTRLNVLSYSNPLEIEEILQSFPKLKIIIAHMGFPWVDIALALAVQYPNIYLDISNLTYMMPKRLKEFILNAKELLGINKLLFGSDGFIPEMIELTVNTFENIDYLSKVEIERIMGLNAQELLFTEN